MLTPEQEREAEAFAVWKRHGDRVPRFVAERIGALAIAGDLAGVERWNEIAKKMDGLMRAPRQ